MIETDCNAYFLSNTAMLIWQKNDINGQNRMFSCLSGVHKGGYFRRVIFKSKHVDETICQELAENAFLSTWETFNNNGKAGKLRFTQTQYTGYFYTAFKGNYLKLLGAELRKYEAEKEFSQGEPIIQEAIVETDALLKARVRNTLDKMSPDCKKLLKWKLMEGLSHDMIAQRKNITRDSSIKMLSRCVGRFIKNWSGSRN
jgi:DNA-directed RNA polymerase specialized sigma24 family protein